MMRLAHPRQRIERLSGRKSIQHVARKLRFHSSTHRVAIACESRQPTMMLDRDLFEFLERAAAAGI
jgi:hypothetical protein